MSRQTTRSRRRKSEEAHTDCTPTVKVSHRDKRHSAITAAEGEWKAGMEGTTQRHLSSVSKLNSQKTTVLSAAIAQRDTGHAQHGKPIDASHTPETSPSARLAREFFNVPGEELAKALLGQKIVRVVNSVRLSARIVETEAYLGAVDKAAHSYKKKTERNKAMFMQPGTAYVYNIYGMYCCLNISSQGDGCAVLIRSVEPVEGLDKMQELRQASSKKSTASKPAASFDNPAVCASKPSTTSSESSVTSSKPSVTSCPKAAMLTTSSREGCVGTSGEVKKKMKLQELGNGPSKLCQSLAITKETLNQRDLVTDSSTWLERGDIISADHVVVSPRINIGYAEDWTDKPLRFYLLNNPCVSVRDRKAEGALKEATKSAYFPSID